MKYEVDAGEDVFTIDIEQDGSLLIDGKECEYDFGSGKDPSLYSLLLENRSYEMRVTETGDEYRVVLQGESIPVRVIDERSKHLLGAREALGGGAGEILVKAPMPGLVVDVLVEPGDEVKMDDTLIILESMKMHNEFRAKRDATVKEVRVQKEDKVLQGDTLLILE